INLVSGESSYQSFTHYSYSNVIPDRQSATESIRASMHTAVGRHLLSDAPIGVFLSGGIDSGIITSVASKFQHERLETLSLYFRETTFSEKQYQDLIINRVQCNSYQHLLTEEEFNVSFPGIISAMDMPSCDGINTWFISKYAKEHHLKAVLSGVGGDELFGGYPSFQRMHIALQLQQAPDTVLRLAERSSTKKINRASYLTLEGIKGLYLFLRGQYIPLQIARQLGATEKEVWNVLRDIPALPFVTSLKPQNKASWMELNMYMQNQLLRDADVMSMVHGVEIRVPFLDEEVIRTGLSIKSSVKYKGPQKKQLLIDTFKDDLPEPVWNRQKMGFTFPFMKWMANSTFVKDTMMQGNTMTRDSYDRFIKGQLHWSHLMSLLILQVRGAG
ncbi:MAG TPA: asparagine synthase C-terminal domain-containing protein, partial [Puia sp.]|nr:asparagine synthase C-terminal domain-containing protein [Puia sp.]